MLVEWVSGKLLVYIVGSVLSIHPMLKIKAREPYKVEYVISK